MQCCVTFQGQMVWGQMVSETDQATNMDQMDQAMWILKIALITTTRDQSMDPRTLSL